jgi:hypothetical protein
MKDTFTEIIEKTLFEVESKPIEVVEQKIIDEYFNHLKENKIHIPVRFKNSIIEDFKTEIRKKVF